MLRPGRRRASPREVATVVKRALLSCSVPVLTAEVLCRHGHTLYIIHEQYYGRLVSVLNLLPLCKINSRCCVRMVLWRPQTITLLEYIPKVSNAQSHRLIGAHSAHTPQGNLTGRDATGSWTRGPRSSPGTTLNQTDELIRACAFSRRLRARTRYSRRLLRVDVSSRLARQ